MRDPAAELAQEVLDVEEYLLPGEGNVELPPETWAWLVELAREAKAQPTLIDFRDFVEQAIRQANAEPIGLPSGHTWRDRLRQLADRFALPVVPR